MGAPETSVSTAGLQSPSQHCKWKTRGGGRGGGEYLSPCPRQEKGKTGEERGEKEGEKVRRSMSEMQSVIIKGRERERET